MATRLVSRRIEKPWGRRDLGPWFAPVPQGGLPVGEIWYEMPGGGEPPLLVKFLFTSERLSIQVHPDDEQARARGLPRGKDEAWVILGAEPGATIALGLKEPTRSGLLAAAARYGSIEEMVDWRPVEAGDAIYSGAGTVHAIGAGLTLVEVQQNVDVTYRLHDYGRPRELHLEDGIAVAKPEPFAGGAHPREVAPGRTVAAQGPKLTVERWKGLGTGTAVPGDGRPLWLVTLSAGTVGGEAAEAGETWFLDEATDVEIGDAIVGYEGGDDLPGAWRAGRAR